MCAAASWDLSTRKDEIDREELLTELIGAIDRFGRSVG